jgi:hypothetical protein
MNHTERPNIVAKLILVCIALLLIPLTVHAELSTRADLGVAFDQNVRSISADNISGSTLLGVTFESLLLLGGDNSGLLKSISSSDIRVISDNGIDRISKIVILFGTHGSGLRGIHGSGLRYADTSEVQGIHGSGLRGIHGSGLRTLITLEDGINSRNAASSSPNLLVLGPVSSIDPNAGTVTILGQTIVVTNSTMTVSLEGGQPSISVGLDKIALTKNDYVGIGGQLTARGVIIASVIVRLQHAYVAGASPSYIRGIIDKSNNSLATVSIGTLTVDYGSVLYDPEFLAITDGSVVEFIGFTDNTNESFYAVSANTIFEPYNVSAKLSAYLFN